MGSSPHFFPPARTGRRSPSRILFLALLVLAPLVLVLLAGGAAIASAVHSKAPSVEPLDAVFHIGASGTIEASLDPPIYGVLRIIVRSAVRAGASTARPQPGGSASASPSQNDLQPITLEVTQSDRPIPFRLVDQSGHHDLVGGRPSLLVADIDVNDLTPGVPVRVCIHSNLPASSNSDPPDLEARAYQVVY
jgi:hypothetical protein